MPARGSRPRAARCSWGSPSPRLPGDGAGCKNAKVPHYHPHDLRHRRITVWHQSGVPARELAERAGHSRPSMSLDVYIALMPADEVPADTVLSLLRS